jgi:hypothetical protein
MRIEIKGKVEIEGYSHDDGKDYCYVSGDLESFSSSTVEELQIALESIDREEPGLIEKFILKKLLSDES